MWRSGWDWQDQQTQLSYTFHTRWVVSVFLWYLFNTSISKWWNRANSLPPPTIAPGRWLRSPSTDIWPWNVPCSNQRWRWEYDDWQPWHHQKSTLEGSQTSCPRKSLWWGTCGYLTWRGRVRCSDVHHLTWQARARVWMELLDEQRKFAINSAVDILPHNANLCRWQKRSVDVCPICGNQ